MTSSKPKTFTEMTKYRPDVFVSDCCELPVDLALDYIDRCYARLSNPKSKRYRYYVEVIGWFMTWLKYPEPDPSSDALEIAAYLRAFPPFNLDAFDRELDRRYSTAEL